MIRLFSAAVLAALALLASPNSGFAQADQKPPGLWIVGLGGYNVFENGGGDSELDLRAEYRVGYRLLNYVRPFVAAELTSEGSAWGGVGFAAEVPFGKSWYAAASFAPGLYTQGGSDLDLDSTIIFRTQFELGYEFTNRQRVSVAFSHLSNASFGDNNPGAEVVTINYHFPF